MPQVFHHSTNLISRLSIYGAFVLILIGGFVPWLVDRSPYVTQQDVPETSPCRSVIGIMPMSLESIAATVTPPSRNPLSPDFLLRKRA